MVEKHIKFIHKSIYREKLLLALEDIYQDNLQKYDVILLKGFPGQKRIRVGDVRIIFAKVGGKNRIVRIDNRGDIY